KADIVNDHNTKRQFWRHRRQLWNLLRIETVAHVATGELVAPTPNEIRRCTIVQLGIWLSCIVGKKQSHKRTFISLQRVRNLPQHDQVNQRRKLLVICKGWQAVHRPNIPCIYTIRWSFQSLKIITGYG